MNRKILETEDGSSTLYVPELDEHYHSFHGAIQESEHVFIEHGLQAVQSGTVKVFEMGFGTGLNCMLTKLHAGNKVVNYTSIEKYPVEQALFSLLNYARVLNLNDEGRRFFDEIHAAPWGKDLQIHKQFSLFKIQGDIKGYCHKSSYNLVYYDAFAPKVQPALWSYEIFKSLYDAMENGGVLTTYCAKGEVRRTLQKCGFEVERLPGPPGKREMLRGVKHPLG